MTATTAAPERAPSRPNHDVPTLVTPLDGAPVDGGAALFEWKPLPKATYRLQITRDAEGREPVFDAPVGRHTSMTLYELLPQDGTRLFWRVQVEGTGRWTPAEPFLAADDDALVTPPPTPGSKRAATGGPPAASGKQAARPRTGTPEGRPVAAELHRTGTSSTAEAVTFFALILASFGLVIAAIFAVS